jgi:hypothetical protein
MKRLHLSLMAAAILLVPSMLLAAGSNGFRAAKATIQPNNMVVVPLEITNEANLVAMDIPLQYSEGVTLKDVTFENTRVEYFDLKIFNNKADERMVVIGLLPQMSAEFKPGLEAGTGVVANLVFEINDPSVTSVTLEAVKLSEPDHSLTFVYNEAGADGQIAQRAEEPKFERTTMDFTSGSVDANLPKVFSLKQNYPNPFNPKTKISFDVPKASRVEVSVWNVLGQKVETLVDDYRDAGVHTVDFDGAKYSSGVYFYRISTAGFSETKKMMLVK